MKKFFALFLLLAFLLPAMTLAKDKFAKIMEPVVKIGTAPVVTVWSGFEAIQVAKNHIIKA